MLDEDKVAVVKSFENGDFSKLSEVVNKLRVKAEERQRQGSGAKASSLSSKKKPSHNRKLSPIRSNSALKLWSFNNLTKNSEFGKFLPSFTRPTSADFWNEYAVSTRITSES